jgi:hypothetical protein
MFKYHGGQKVQKGTYWNFTTGRRIQVTGEEELPGNDKTTYYKLSPLGILVAGPILGLFYAAFLPFIGIAMVVKLLAQKSFGGAFNALGRGISFGWRPGEAYLDGKKKEGKDKNNDNQK